jgi:hypothetical protein
MQRRGIYFVQLTPQRSWSEAAGSCRSYVVVTAPELDSLILAMAIYEVSPQSHKRARCLRFCPLAAYRLFQTP